MEMPVVLPLLREELQLHSSAPDENGHPCWTLLDSIRNRFFRVGKREVEILSRWGLDPQEVARKVTEATALTVEAEEVIEMAQFITSNELAAPGHGGNGEGFYQKVTKKKKSIFASALHNYLFFRIPLIKPDRFLDRSFKFVAPLFSRSFAAFIFFAAFCGLILVSRQWEAFTGTALQFLTTQGLFFYGVALVLTKIIHELGHAYAAKKYGLRVPTMGVAFLVMFPVLYTDTTEAWKLTTKRSRLLIAGAGMMAELTLAVIATCAWLWLPDGIPRSVAFLTASTSWVLTLMVNLNPFMRFDGYYLFADGLGVANLQPRSFALAKWYLRERLWGIVGPKPESFRPALTRILIGYAYLTWIYRFFLFLGIALMVYAFFFKVLGIFLMVVEVLCFIILPVANEMKTWWHGRAEISSPFRAYMTLGLVSVMISGIFIPFSTAIYAPAIFEPSYARDVYYPVSARVQAVRVAEGEQVGKGDILLQLINPELQYQMGQAKERLKTHNIRLERASSGALDPSEIQVLAEEKLRVEKQLSGLKEEAGKLSIKAPLSGEIVDLPLGLEVGEWVQKDRKLGRMKTDHGATVEAYIDENDLFYLNPQTNGHFYLEGNGGASIEIVVQELEVSALSTLGKPYQASLFGGGGQGC